MRGGVSFRRDAQSWWSLPIAPVCRMKLTLPENSLFAILLRSRWWVSLLVALGGNGGQTVVSEPGPFSFWLRATQERVP